MSDPIDIWGEIPGKLGGPKKRDLRTVVPRDMSRFRGVGRYHDRREHAAFDRRRYGICEQGVPGEYTGVLAHEALGSRPGGDQSNN